MIDFPVVLCLALLVDIVVGDPENFPHPVVGIGKLIQFWEARLYSKSRQRGAAMCLAVILSTLTAVVLILLLTSFNTLLATVIHVYLLSSAIAWRSLKDQTLPVALALFHHNLLGARGALAKVVGRDTESLSEQEISRAAIETVAENSIDGILSVIFFAALGWAIGGAVGMSLLVWIFKAASTMDSMIAYDNSRYHDFGFCAAKLDDTLNFIPARIGGLVIIISGFCMGHSVPRAFAIFGRDRKKHKSPNSAHGESAFAGLLGVKLGGGAIYHGIFEQRPWLGDDTREIEPADILRSHRILDASVALFALFVIALFLPL